MSVITVSIVGSAGRLGAAICCIAAMAPAIAIGATNEGQRAAWAPTKPIELIVGTAPSGGADRPARVLQKILQDQRLVPVPVAVINKPGAAGAISQVYLNQHAGDAHYLSVSPPTLVTSYLTGKSAISYEDVTVLAIMASEYVAFAVHADSPIKTARDLAERLRQDPSSVSIGIGTGIGNNNHAAVGLFAKAIGADITKFKAVVFNSPGEVLVSLLGKHLDLAALAASNLLAMAGNPDIRFLAIAAPNRLSGRLASVPTLKEQGWDVVGQQWRAVIGPKGMSAAQIAYWNEVLTAVSKTAEWKQYLDSVANENNFRINEEARDFVRDEQEKMKAVLTALGLAREPAAKR